MTVGFPDQLRSAILNRPIQDIRRDLATASLEAVTGRKENLAVSLGSRTGEYNLVAKALTDIKAGLDRLTLAESRLSATAVPLKAIRVSVNEFATTAEFTIGNDGFETSDVSQAAREQIEYVMSSLNTDYAGRNLFSGDQVSVSALPDASELFEAIDTALGGATDEASIDAALDAFFADGGTFDTDIYQGGDDEAAAILLSNRGRVNFSVKANDPSIKSALEGLARLAYAQPEASEEYLDGAISDIRKGETGLISLEASLGRKQNRVESEINALYEEQSILKQTEDRYAGVDGFEAATRLNNLELQLEAAYTVTARISQLSLTNYIR